MIESVTDVEFDQDKVIHAIIVPNYKEDVDGLRETLDVLASHPQARMSYDVSIPNSEHHCCMAMGLIDLQ